LGAVSSDFLQEGPFGATLSNEARVTARRRTHPGRARRDTVPVGRALCDTVPVVLEGWAVRSTASRTRSVWWVASKG